MVSGIEAKEARVPGTRMFRFGLSLAGLGALLTGYATLIFWPVLSGLVFNPTYAVPGEFQQQLDEGDYLVSIQTSFSTASGPITFTQTSSVEVLDISITDPDGVELAFTNGSNQNINRNGDGFSGVAVFTAAEPGIYNFDLSTSVETNALVTRSLDSAAIVPFALGFVGGVAFILGLVLALVGFLSRRDHKKRPLQPAAGFAPQVPYLPGPGYAPPPPPPTPAPPPVSAGYPPPTAPPRF